MLVRGGPGGFVRVDMESSQYTDRTLGIVRKLGCGTVIQAYICGAAKAT